MPKPSDSGSGELTGAYLRAMQEITVHLMDALPSGDTLWGILAHVEALLLEAQFQGEPVGKLFGTGGTAAFCQSIIDEENALRTSLSGESPPVRTGKETAPTPVSEQHSPQNGREPLPASPNTAHNRRRMPSDRSRNKFHSDSRPAAFDRKKTPTPPKPRGEAQKRKKRIVIGSISGAFVLLLALLFLWYTGVLAYMKKGSAFYLDELYNFQSTTETLAPAVSTVRFPLQTSFEGAVLYDDGDTFRVRVGHVQSEDVKVRIKGDDGTWQTDEKGHFLTKRVRRWYLDFFYTVDARFSDVSYVRPGKSVTVKMRFPDGRSYEAPIQWESSGSAGGNTEYIRAVLPDFPEGQTASGTEIELYFDTMIKITWKRVSVGPRRIGS